MKEEVLCIEWKIENYIDAIQIQKIKLCVLKHSFAWIKETNVCNQACKYRINSRNSIIVCPKDSVLIECKGFDAAIN